MSSRSVKCEIFRNHQQEITILIFYLFIYLFLSFGSQNKKWNLSHTKDVKYHHAL